MPAYQHFVGIVTHLLSALAFYLMLYKTPNSGKAFAKYLMLLQASITLVDLNFGLLASPVALFPVPGGLCNGIICTWFGFTGHAGITVMFFAVAFVAIALIYCFHYRFVSIGHILGQDSFEAPRHSAFRAIIFVVYTIPCVLQIGLYRNIDGGPLFVKTNFPSLNYLIENPDYRAFVYDLTLFPEYSITVASSTIFIMILAILIVFYFVVYSFISLSRQSSLSDKTTHIQHQLMRLLLVQTFTPLAIQLAPLFIYSYSMITVSLDPNIGNALFCFQLTHAFVHTAVMILTTPSYREPFMFWHKKKRHDSPTPSRFSHQVTQLRIEMK